MNSLPDGPRGRLLALALLALALGGFWLAIAAPLLDLYADRAERLADQRGLLARETRLAAAVPALTRAAATNQPTATRLLLAGDSDAIAGASLQGMLQDMAGAAGASLASAEALPVEQQGAYRRIGLRVTLNADWPLLMALLEAVETSQYRLLLDDLQLHAVARVQVGAGSAAPPIDASFVVLGFRPGYDAGSGSLRADATNLPRE